MKKQVFRVLSIFLAFVIIIGLMPIATSALRCKHTGSKHWEYYGNTSSHVQICNDCGARIKAEDHDVTKNDEWNFVYLDVDTDMSGGGMHQQICKKCGYTYYNDHYYSKQIVEINGAKHPNVLICSDPHCNHIKEFDTNGSINNHLYYTKYVNGDYHVTSCAYCDYAPGEVYQNGFKKVASGKVDYNNLDQYYVFANNGAYKQYKYLSDAEKKKYTTFYVLSLGFHSHKAGKDDYEKHNWYSVRNASQHWTECHGCHATYDKAGHDFYTYVVDDGWHYSKTTVCETCGWVKSIKSTSEKNDKGKWINIKEHLDSLQKILDYNGCPDEQPKPGHGGDKKPCEHPAYYTVYGPGGETRVDNFHYLYLGDKHEKRCDSCNEALSTENCSYKTETFENVRQAYLKNHTSTAEELGNDYIPWLYMEDYFKSGHYQVCSVCKGKKLVAHRWSESPHSDADVCKRTCKDCGFTMTYRQRSEGSKDPSPHTYLSYQDNYWVDANQEIHDPDSGCCSYKFTGTSSSHKHKSKCEICGYEHTEKCDTDGWCELPGQSGKHLQFCSKCGGGKTVVDCGHDYVAGDNLPAGFHAVKCPSCSDVYIPKTPCDYVLDQKNTDEFKHTYKCTYCGFEWHDNHTRKTIKTNVKPATADKDGSYDLVTFCEVCNKEIARSTINIPKKSNPNALANVEAVYVGETRNNAHLGSGSSYLNGTIVMNGVSEYLANNSKTLLNGATFDPSHDFFVDGKQISHNSSTRIMLYANALMTVTDYTQDDDDVDEDDDKAEYTSMTANVNFTYSAHYVTTVNGVDYRDNTPVYDGDGKSIYNLPLDLSGAPITMTLPLLTGMSSNQTMYVRQTTDNGANYTTYLGDFDSDYGVSCVTFTTEDGFDGEFLFVPTEHWLEHHERQEPTDNSDGNIEYWHDKGTDKYYSDILCEHEITKAQTYINANTYTIDFAAGGGTGNAPASITGVHKQEDVTLPACTYTNPGYVFYGWSSGDWVYKAGDLYTVTGDATLTAKWHTSGDTMCHVTFHPNGENVEGTMDEQVCKPNDTIRLQKNIYTREGYTFYGWSTTPQRQVPPYAFDKNTISPSTDIDLYAIWQPTYYITFDANGGEGTMKPQAYESSPLLPGDGWYVPYAGLNSNTYTRDGYEFKYWAKNSDGSGDTYTDGGVSPMDTTNPENITLYAIWEKTRFTVNFDANCDDATGETASMKFDKGIWDVIPECGYEREGYVFEKWAENPDGTGNTVYKPGLLRTFNQDTTLYAVWKKTHKVTFDGNGADNSMSAQTVNEGESTKLSEFTLKKDGYSTSTYCWNTKPDGSGTKYYDGAYVNLNDDLTLYAQWNKTRFIITYDANGGEGESYTQTADFGEGMSSICPRCSKVNHHFLDAGIDVSYCNCCGFGVALKDEGSTDNLATRSYGSLSNYTLGTKFDNLATSYAAFDADKTEDNYTAFFDKAKEVLNGSVSKLTKNADYTAASSALIGVGNNLIYNIGETERTYDQTISAVARLFGYDDAATFAQYAQNVAAVYHANGIGASTSYRLKYIGAVYTDNGSFILPYAFKSNRSDTALLSFVIVDADGNVSVWLDSLEDMFSITAYDQTLPENSNTTLDVYGCCELYENPRALENEFTKDRYVFSKWNTKSDGSGTSYTPGSTAFTSSMGDDLTLYAIWSPDFSTITFDANGGEGEMEPQIVDNNIPTTLNKNIFTREGYIFLGWGSSPTATYGYNDEATVTYRYDTTLYARWAKAITITFDAGEGFGTMKKQVVAENTYTALNPNTFQHETKGFNYWSLTPDGARAYYDKGSVKLTEDITLYAIWKNKSDASSKITFEDMTVPYTGEVQTPEVTLADFTQYSNPTTSFLYYSGTEVSRDNLLTKAPTDVGTYTVRAIYEDSIYKGYKDATLTITKAERDLVPTASMLLLYGRDKNIALRLADGDNTAISDLTVTSEDESIVTQRESEIYKSDGLIVVPISYVGEGYTNISFTLPATKNYEAAEASLIVIAKDGYNVNIDEITGGTVTVDKAKAPEGTEVNVTASSKPGYTLEKLEVTHENSGSTYEISDGKFTMPEQNVLISASFIKNDYTITYKNVDGVTYSSELPESAHYGDKITLSAETDGTKAVKGYRYSYGDSAVTVNIAPNKNGEFVFNMPAQNITIEAVKGNEYDITVDDSVTNGSIAVSAAKATEEKYIIITPNADDGYTAGTISYTANGDTKSVTVGIDDNGNQVYSILMPDANVTISAEFIPNDVLTGAADSVNENAKSEQGKNEAQIAVDVDDAAAEALQAAVDAIDVNLNVSGSRSITDDEKSSAIEALAQAGMIVVEDNDGEVTVRTADNNDVEIRVVEKTYLEVEVKDYEQTDGNMSVTLNITPMKQTVATIEDEGTTLDSENSVPLTQAEEIDVTDMTEVTVGIPAAIAEAAGGAGKTIYVQHTHKGIVYEYPAVIQGNATDGYTATFNNPNGYSEFTLSTQSNSVASFEYKGTTYSFTSFAKAIEDALKKDVTEITMHRMPVGEDIATITKAVTLTFTVAQDCDNEKIDFDAIYTDWLETDDDVRKASTPEQLAEHKMSFVSNKNEAIYTTQDGTEIDLSDTFTRDAADTANFGIGNVFKNFEILGVQKKNNDSQRAVRFVAVLNNDVVQDAEDYGFIAVTGEDMDAARANIAGVTLNNISGKNVFSCKETSNSVSGDYGKYDADKDYKYITFAVNNIRDKGVAVMFYLKDKNGNIYYATYTNKSGTTYNNCAVDWAAITSNSNSNS